MIVPTVLAVTLADDRILGWHSSTTCALMTSVALTCCLFTPSVTRRSHWLNSRPGQDIPATPPEDEFSPFELDTYEELNEVPQLHLDYLTEQRDAGQPALGFVFIRHVLAAGPVDISGLTDVALSAIGTVRVPLRLNAIARRGHGGRSSR